MQSVSDTKGIQKTCFKAVYSTVERDTKGQRMGKEGEEKNSKNIHNAQTRRRRKTNDHFIYLCSKC